LEISFWCVGAYELMRKGAFQLFWCGASNGQNIFAFGWVDVHTINLSVFIVAPLFVTAVKLLGN